MTDDLVASGYDAVYDGITNSPTFERIWTKHARDPDYPAEFANISFLTFAELRALRDALSVGDGDLVVDLACGAGGPGLWVASQAKARLVGIDVSVVGLRSARSRASRLGLDSLATFSEGSFSSVPVDDGAAHGAMSVDALHYAHDKQAAFHEVHRFLRPGGRLVFTAFEVHPDRTADLPVVGDDPIADYQPAMTAAGLAVEHYAETPGWRDRVEGAYGAVIAEADTLGEEMGGPALMALASEMTVTLDRDLYRRRVLAVARNP